MAQLHASNVLLTLYVPCTHSYLATVYHLLEQHVLSLRMCLLTCHPYLFLVSTNSSLFFPSPSYHSGHCLLVSSIFLFLSLSACACINTDIKPSNILVNTNGAVKLCDFGVSTQVPTTDVQLCCACATQIRALSPSLSSYPLLQRPSLAPMPTWQ